jgi:hypothetical protein
VRRGISEVCHYAIAKVFGDVASESAYRVGGRTVIRGHGLLPLLRIEPGRNLSRTNQVTEQYSQMAAFT